MGIGKLRSLADFTLLLLRLGLGRNALNLSCTPPLCSVGSRLHSILLKILFYINHITRQFNTAEKLFQVIIHLNVHFGVVRVGNVFL